MATTFVSAGVYISERDDSLYSPALSPTAIGIIGTGTKGNLNEATLVRTEAELINTFGFPRTKDYGIHAAAEALKAARLVYYVRIAGAAATNGVVNVMDAGSGATAACIGPSSNGEKYNLLNGSTESPTGTRTTQIDIRYDNGAGLTTAVVTFQAVQAFVNNGSGSATYALSNGQTLTIVVNGGPVQTVTFLAADPLVSGNGGIGALTPTGVAAVINDQLIGGEARIATNVVTIASDRFGSGSTIQVTGGTANGTLGFGTTLQSGSGHVADLEQVLGSEIKTRVEAFTTSNVLVTVGLTGTVRLCTATTGSTKTIRIESATSPMVGASPKINLTPLDSTVSGTNSTAAANTISFTAKTKGSHSANIKVRISDDSSLTGTKKVEILYRDVIVEVFTRAFKSPTPVTGGQAMITLINSGATDGSQSASDFVTAADLNVSGENPANGTYTLSTGNNGDDWTASTVIGTDSGSTQTGLQIFKNPEKIFVNVLCTPGISYASVISEGLTICQNRADCIFVADAPKGLSPTNVVKWHNGDSSVTATVDQENRTETNSTAFNSSYGALYYPFVKVADKFNGVDIFIPPSSIILRTYAYTDQVADPWFAPAGPNRTQAQTVRDLELSPSLADRDLMQLPGNNLNPIANVSGFGVVVLGQKTLQRAPTSLDRVNVRRLLLLAEKAVAQSVFFLLFEPNDDRMWRRFINLVSPIFEDIKARRGLFDFRVVADSSTNTDTLINQNTFLGRIYIQPTKAAEKMIVSFNLTPTGANFEEFPQV